MGNILSGLDLLRRTSDSPVDCYGMCFPLLTNAEGVKMGKSVGGAIWLSSGKPCTVSSSSAHQEALQFMHSILSSVLNTVVQWHSIHERLNIHPSSFDRSCWDAYCMSQLHSESFQL